MQRSLAFFVAIICMSCSPQPKSNASREVIVQTTTTKSTAEPPQEDSQAKMFKEKVAKYLEEARAGIKLLAVGPTSAEVTKKSELITDLYTHLPDVPSQFISRVKLAERLKDINDAFKRADSLVKERIACLRDGMPVRARFILEDYLPQVFSDLKSFVSQVEFYIAQQP